MPTDMTINVAVNAMIGSTVELAFDIALASLVVWLAWRLLSVADLFRATVLFIVFGLLVALAWVRMRAPDLALAEAAIGAGLTGALLLDTLRRLGASGAVDEARPLRLTPLRVVAATAIAAFGAILAWAIVTVPSDFVGLASAATAALPASGVSNPVTAALLNYRAYDTLLELAVLLTAALGVWVLEAEPAPRAAPADPVLTTMVRVLVPLAIVTGAYLLWIGSKAPGGAFQGGALIAGAVVLLHLVRPFAVRAQFAVRLALGIGVAVFALAGVALAAFGTGFLQYPPGQAGWWILGIEAFAMVTIVMVLTALFAGSLTEQEAQ